MNHTEKLVNGQFYQDWGHVLNLEFMKLSGTST
jgi:hypothetical protein